MMLASQLTSLHHVGKLDLLTLSFFNALNFELHFVFTIKSASGLIVLYNYSH